MGFFKSQQPSTELLIQIHYIFLQMITDDTGDPNSPCVARLLFQNMLDDGKFARTFHDERFYVLFPLVRDCMDKAIEQGDMRDTGMNEQECLWFLHHIAVMITLNGMPDTPVFEYRKNHKPLIADVLQYCMRGIGMTEEAIQRYTHPKKLEPVIQQLLKPIQELAN